MNFLRMTEKYFRTGSWLLVLAIVLTVAVCGCKKTDDTYTNFQNTAGRFNGSALAYLQSQPGVYDSMLLVINRLTGIRDSLTNNDLTVFAVTNRSFSLALQNINQARRDSIPAMPEVSFSTMDSAVLDTFFCRYLVHTKQLSDDLTGFTDGRLFSSLRYNYNMQMQFTQTNASGYLHGGPKAIIFSDPKNSVFTRNWIRATTITVDVKTANAVVHLLPPGHDFGFGTDFIRNINKR